MLSYSPISHKTFISWYDPATNLCRVAHEMNEDFYPTHLALIADQFVIAIGHIQNSMFCKFDQFIQMLDLFSQKSSWVPMTNMLVHRERLGVGVLNNNLYAVSYSLCYSFVFSVIVKFVCVYKLFSR